MHADTSSWPTEAELNWTPRQLEVIQLIAKGYTNAQIAEQLDISLAGAKWHVSEILSKLGVESRENIPDYWRSRRSLGSRFRRQWALGLGLLSGKVAMATAALAIVVPLVAAVGMLMVAGGGTRPAESAPSTPQSPAETAARETLSHLAPLVRFTRPSTFDGTTTGAFEVVSVQGSDDDTSTVTLLNQGVLIDDQPYDLVFRATVRMSDHSVLEAGFDMLRIDDPSGRGLRLGPFIEAARVDGPRGTPYLLAISRGRDGWWSATGAGSLAFVGNLASADGLSDRGLLSWGGGIDWFEASSTDRVREIRLTLATGAQLTIHPTTPPEELGFHGRLFFAALPSVHVDRVQALDDSGAVIDDHDMSNRGPEPPPPVNSSATAPR